MERRQIGASCSSSLDSILSIRRMQRLAANFTAMLAAMAVALIQPGASACRCDAAGSGSCCSKPAGPSCCSGKSCQAEATSCCCTTGVPAADVVGCSCSAPAQDTPATAPVSSTRILDSDGGALLAPLFAVADLGLHGASWATAFDLEALGRPPGLRLHALLCVWRN